MSGLDRRDDELEMPDGRPKPFQAMLDATRLCFPACNELSQQIGDGTLNGTALVQTLRTLAYAIETIAAFQMSQYEELVDITLDITRDAQQIKDSRDREKAE